jgi:hypothetical protein
MEALSNVIEFTDSFDESNLRNDFQDGLKALREEAERRDIPRAGDVQPIARNDTNVVVYLGVWPTDRYPAVEYDEPKYAVFVQIPARFPTGGGKGFATVPPLDRNDRTLANNEWSDGLDDVVDNHIENTDVDVQSYSYNWENAALNQAEDMRKFHAVANEFLSRG